MIRAFLLAHATAATFLFRRLISPANQWLAWLACYSTTLTTERAP